MSQRRGFTLIELLVATAVFTFGFTAAFGMFLAALRYRTLADDTIKLSLAASSIPEEIAIGKISTSVTPPPNPFPPSRYDGDGLPIYGATQPSLTTSDVLLSYPSIPGTWYRIEKCTDLLGFDTNTATTTLHAELVVLAFSQAQGTSLKLDVVWNRLRPLQNDLPGLATYRARTVPNNLTPEESTALIDLLVRRGMAIRRAVVIVRRPAWMT